VNSLKKIMSCVCILSILCLCSCELASGNKNSDSSQFTHSDDKITSSEISDKEQIESEQITESENSLPSQSASTSTQSKPQTSSAPNKKPVTTSRKPTTTTTVQKPQQTKPLVSLSPDEYYGWTLLKKNGTEAEKKAYQKLATEVGNFKNIVTFDFKLSEKEFEKAYGLYKEDYPEHFWKGNEYTLSGTENNISTISFDQMLYNGDVNKIKETKNKMEANAQKILAKLNGSMSDYEKELVVHDYIINNTIYKDAENSHILIGALVDGKAVCQGYALAFQYVMRHAGVQCITVTGDFKNQSHMWNMIKLDGEFYHIDVTADDPIVNSGENIEIFDYFNLTDKEIKVNHKLNTTEFTPPAATAIKYEFFKTTGQVYSKFSVDAFAKSIAYAYNHGYKYAYMRYENDDISKVMSFIKDNYYKIIDKANALLGSKKIKPDTKINVLYGQERGIVDFKIKY